MSSGLWDSRGGVNITHTCHIASLVYHHTQIGVHVVGNARCNKTNNMHNIGTDNALCCNSEGA